METPEKNRFSKKQIGLAVLAAVVLVAAAVIIMCTKPVITLNGEAASAVEVFATYTDAGASAGYLFFNISDRIETSSEVNTDKTGIYTVDYTVSFFGKTVTAERIVTVTDTTPPVIVLLGEKEMRVQDITEFEDPGVQAEDNYDGDISGYVKLTHTETEFTQGERKGETEYIFTYSVKDSGGNAAEVKRTVIAKDDTPPVITLNGESAVTVIAGQPYEERGASAEDNVTKEIKVEISGGVNTAVPGKYTVVYTASDEAGNKATAERTVTVKAALPKKERGVSLVPGGSYVALTFDDGPSANTSVILDILGNYGVKATFFVINYSEGYIPVLKRIVNEGHTLAIHTYSHAYSEIYTSADAYMQGVYKMQDKILRDTGYSADVLRFPGGTSNTVSRSYCTGVMSAIAARAENEGFSYFDWNVDSGDADGNCVETEYIISNVTSALHSGRVNVVLMHDAGAKTTTPQALGTIIENAKERGFEFIPLSSDVPAVHHGINN